MKDRCMIGPLVEGKASEKHTLISVLLIGFAAFLVYANSLGNGFVVDDHSVIIRNPALRGSLLSAFDAIDTGSHPQLNPFYRPFTYLTFLAEWRLHGFDPLLMHLVNVVLHVVNAMLVFLLARSLLGDPRPAFLAGLLFAVHPIHSESVNYLSGGRNTMLACFFVLSAYLVQERSIARQNNSFAVIGALLFLAGLFSKEFALMVLPLIIAQEVVSLRVQESAERHAAVKRMIPYAIATAVYLLLRWLTLSRLGIQSGIIPGLGAQKLSELYVIPSLQERLVNNIYIIPKYLATIIWPTSLSPRYAVPEDLWPIAPMLALAWVIIIGIAIWFFTRGRSAPTLFGLYWTLLFWLPVSGLVYFSIIEMADRYFYIPAIGIWIILADQSLRLLCDRQKALKYVTIATTAILIGLTALTVQRNRDWMSDISLFSRMVDQYPDNPYGHTNMGTVLLMEKDPKNLSVAEQHLEKALALDPDKQFVQPLLGYIRLERNDLDGALHYFSEALRYFPMDREARINRAITYERMGRDQDALSDYEYYLQIPGYNDLTGSREYALERVRALSR